MPTTELRPLHVIAAEIRRVWRRKDGRTAMYFGAVPYVDALASMSTARDAYGADSGVSVVLYALANMGTFRGADARRIKAELKAHAKAAGARV